MCTNALWAENSLAAVSSPLGFGGAVVKTAITARNNVITTGRDARKTPDELRLFECFMGQNFGVKDDQIYKRKIVYSAQIFGCT